MKIAIIGAGAVGLYYGARLQRAGEELSFLLRSDFDAIRERGIRVRASDGNFALEQVRACRSPDEIGEVDLAIIALKATSNHVLAELLAPVVGPETMILSLQNGLGADRMLKELYPANRLLCGLCFICLNRVEPGVVENYHLGSIALGEYGAPASKETKRVGAMLDRAGLNCHVSDDLRLMQWKKLVWNVPFNGLSIAAGGVTTDVIVAEEGLLRLARGLMEEIVEGATAFGMTIDPSFIDLQIEQTRTMGEYKPSSLVDFLEGKQVEVEAIWGEPLRQASEAGVELPKLETLYRLLRLLCADRQG